MISIVLGTYNRLNFLQLTIDSIRSNVSSIAYEIIVIDGGSDDGTIQWLCQQKDIITIIQHNRGTWHGKPINRRSWGYFMNLGFKAAQGKYVCMLSDDCVIVPGSIHRGLSVFEHALEQGRKVGAVAFYWRDGVKENVYHVGTPMGHAMYVNHGMYLKTALEEINYIDEIAYAFYFADIDLSFRLWQAGYEVIDSPDSFVEHYPYANLTVRSTNEKKAEQDFKVFLSRWGTVYSDLTNHTISAIRTKEFDDQTRTIDIFNKLHDQVVTSNPKLFKEPTFARRCYAFARWKVILIGRKASNLYKSIF